MDTSIRRGTHGAGGGPGGTAPGASGGSGEANGSFRTTFGRVAAATANATGSAWAFLSAVGIIAVWAITGPLFGFSDTWQLVINTGTTIVTFLMVFLIQNTQNRDATAIHLKLDELVRAVQAARNEMISVQEGTDEELAELQQEFREVRQPGTGVPQPPDKGEASRAA